MLELAWCFESIRLSMRQRIIPGLRESESTVWSVPHSHLQLVQLCFAFILNTRAHKMAWSLPYSPFLCYRSELVQVGYFSYLKLEIIDPLAQ